MTEIKIIFLLAYDFELVKLSLPCVYNHADKILFSIDINLRVKTNYTYLNKTKNY